MKNKGHTPSLFLTTMVFPLVTLQFVILVPIRRNDGVCV